MIAGLIALGVIALFVLLFIFLPVVAWIILGLILAILLVVLFVPIGADVAYVGGEFSLAARMDGFTIQLIPKKTKQETEEKPKKRKPKKEKKLKNSCEGLSSGTQPSKIEFDQIKLCNTFSLLHVPTIPKGIIMVDYS